MKMNRRAFLWKTLHVARSGFGIGGAMLAGHLLLRERTIEYPIGQDFRNRGRRTRLIRPPGAVQEPGFLAGCVRCYRCQDACEPGAIQFFTEADGKHFHTPYVDPSLKACNLCMKCTTVCPTGVLLPLEPADRAKVRMGTVELREDLCLSYKAKRIRREQALLWELGQSLTETEAAVQRRGPCGECYMFCPVRERAIKLEPGSYLAPIIFTEHCTGCGLCEEICRVMVRGDPAIRVVPVRT
jgi:ferredoxin-type protein NapG